MQLLNKPLEITVTPSGSTILVIPLHPSNALEPIETMPLGIIIFVIVDWFLNAPEPIAVTGNPLYVFGIVNSVSKQAPYPVTVYEFVSESKVQLNPLLPPASYPQTVHTLSDQVWGILLSTSVIVSVSLHPSWSHTALLVPSYVHVASPFDT